jgi:hypothetical protein
VLSLKVLPAYELQLTKHAILRSRAKGRQSIDVSGTLRVPDTRPITSRCVPVAASALLRNELRTGVVQEQFAGGGETCRNILLFQLSNVDFADFSGLIEGIALGGDPRQIVSSHVCQGFAS